MAVRVTIKTSTYFDSVSLMSLSTKANQIEGVDQAVVAMGTEMNKGVLRNVGLFVPQIDEAGAGEHHAHADVTAHRIDCDSRCKAHSDALRLDLGASHHFARFRYFVRCRGVSRSQAAEPPACNAR